MSATSQQHHSQDDVHSVETIDMRGDNVTDFVKFIEAHPSTGSTGAREMIKAGQRRLRQLAQRQRKPTDPRIKAEESARQLAALQEGGFLPSTMHPPVTIPRRSGHKKSLDSSRSSSRSISNLSFKSSSRRDVESIGQPWLTDPLEKKDRIQVKPSQLSSVDLRDLTSLVEDAVSLPPQFDDTNPPPYQPPNPANDARNDIPHLDQTAAARDTAADTKPESDEPPLAEDQSIAHPNLQGPTEPSEGKELIVSSPRDNSASEGNMPNHKDKLDLKPGANMKTTDLKIDTETANKPASSGSSARSTSQPTPSLKLFPDTMPPRISSKNAWRISNVHPLALNRPLPAAPGSQRAVNEPNAERPKPSDNLPRKDPSVASGSRHSTSTDARKSGNDPIRSPTTETFPHKKSFRRPSSLPMCTIDAFPLPAPMRPLPSLPESTPPITIGDRNATGKSAPPERLVLDGKNSAACMQDEPTIPEISSGPSLISFVRAGQSRAERVHALKLRDMSASRLYLKESETPQEEGTQLPEPKKDSRVPSQDRVETQTPSKELESPTDGNRRYQRKVAAVPPSPPPLSPPPSKPSRHLVAQSIGRRYCTAPISSSTASCKDNEPPALPLSGKAPQVHRSNSARSLDASERRVNKESVSRSEMPIPSSDDDCTGGSTQDREHSTSSKRRRTKPAPLRLGEPSLHKVRTGRKSSDHPDPLTPRDPRARMSERTSPQSHHSQSTYYSNDSRGSHSQSSQIIRSLEARIAHLERHNKVLQAALLAALDVGMKENLESVLGGSATSVSTSSMTPATARSFSSTTNSSILDDSAGEDRKSARSKEPPFRPTSWIASPGSSRRSSCESEDSAHVRELEDMMEDFEFDWMSDKEDSARPPALHK